MTLQLRSSPLYDYAEYFLESNANEQAICATTATAIHLYSEDDKVREIIGDDLPIVGNRETLRNRMNRCRRLEEYACSLVAQAEPHRRAVLIREGLLSLRYYVSELAECVAHWFFEDSTIGGCIVQKLDQPRLTNELLPTPRLDRRLHSRSAMKHYYPTTLRGTYYETTKGAFDRLMRLPQEGVWDGDLCDGVDDIYSDFKVIRERSRAGVAAYERRIMDEIRQLQHERAQIQIDWIDVRLKPGVLRKAKKRIAAQNKVIKRSANIAAAVVGQETVSKFCRREPVVIRGAKADYEIALSRALHTKGHGAIKINILDKWTAERISGLCLYWDDVPALDQLAAIGLYAQAGDDEELIAGGNVYAINTAADLAIIDGRVREAAERQRVIVEHAREERRHGRRQGFDQTLFDENKHVYVEWAKPIFTELLGIRIFGRRARAINELSMKASAAPEPFRIAA